MSLRLPPPGPPARHRVPGDSRTGVPPPAPAPPRTEQPLTLADITERLVARLGGQLGPVAIARVVRQCHRELEIAHGPVAPEALEYLAHERLRDQIGQAPR